MSIAKEYMNSPITIDSKSHLDQVLKKILDEKISRLLITEDGKITGLVSEKDLGLFLLSDSSERKLDQILVSEISKNLISVDENTKLSECSEQMLTNSIGSLGVKSGNDVVGILTKTDLVKYFANTYPGKKIVGEYMSPYYAWQYSDSNLSKVVSKMIDDKLSRMIIRDHSELPIGIITFRDLFNMSLKLGEDVDVVDDSDPLVSVIFPRKGFVSDSGFGASTKAEEVMTQKIVSVAYDEDLAKTSEKLVNQNINGAGVLSQNNNLVGIISKTDIIKALAFLK